jgi:penicillin-binding protein 1A
MAKAPTAATPDDALDLSLDSRVDPGNAGPPPRNPWYRRLSPWLVVPVLAGFLVAGGVYALFARGLPSVAELADYDPPLSTRVLAGDGMPVTEFTRERRAFVPYDQMPERLIEAFLSAEDKTFFEHGGIDYPGLANAVLTNLRNIGKDRRPIGASTITQQVAKNLIVGDDLSYVRKVREAIVARRLEAAFTKERILEIYLNQIFLGLNSYGVGAASIAYFNKALNELTLAEMAYLAALPKGPNNYHPIRRKADAIERRNWVLGEMADNGFITADERQIAQAADLVIAPVRPPIRTFNGDYFLEEVRRDLAAKMGEDEVYGGGLTVRSTLDSRLQTIAEQVFRDALVRFERGRRWRGPVDTISLEGNWQRALDRLNVPVGYDTWKPAVVTARSAGGFTLGFIDGSSGRLPSWNAAQWRDRNGASAAERLKVGDVIVVTAGQSAGEYAMRQVPEISGGFVALDPHTGRILAMVGGFDSRKSQFNRATQALRQPGSAFKPFVYAAALDNGYTPSSLIVDDDFCVFQNRREGTKCFRNFSGRTYGPQTLRTGVELSRNLMTVRLADRVGMDKISQLAGALDITPNMLPVLSMALGAGETTVARLSAAYGMLVNGGKFITPTVIDSIQDRRGKVVWRHEGTACRDCNATDWLGLPMPALPDPRRQAMNPLTAYQITHIMEGVIERGTARVAAGLNRPLAGKTGTTNEATNVWFVGMSPDLVVGLYIGYDTPRPMGGWAQGGTVAAPIFRDFMAKALDGQPKVPFRLPDGIRLVRVDARTGRLASGEAGERIIYEAFKPGTEPLRPSQRQGLIMVAQTDADFAEETGGIY